MKKKILSAFAMTLLFVLNGCTTNQKSPENPPPPPSQPEKTADGNENRNIAEVSSETGYEATQGTGKSDIIGITPGQPLGSGASSDSTGIVSTGVILPE